MKRSIVLVTAVLCTLMLVTILCPAAGATTLDDALTLYRSGDIRGAADRLERLKERDPNNVVLRFYLGYAYYRLGHLDLARQEFSAVYRLDPGYSPKSTR